MEIIKIDQQKLEGQIHRWTDKGTGLQVKGPGG